MASKKPKPSLWERIKGLIIKPLSNFGKGGAGDRDSEAEKAEERARQQQRKRDEFVRRRELESLRKMRDNNKDGPANDFEAPPSTTSPNTDISAREATLRKINEIERMMSVDVKAAPRKPDETSKNRAFLDTQPMQMSLTKPVVVGEQKAPDQQRMGLAFKSTEVMDHNARPPLPSPSPVVAAAKAAAKTSAGRPPPAEDERAGAGDFMLSQTMPGFMPSTKSMAMEVQEVSHDPMLEEAAILFANAEYKPCEQVLKHAIAKGGTNHLNQETWRALFDLFRATGDQIGFESLGLDFVDVFETSAPGWFNMNDQLGGNRPAPVSVGGSAAAYICQPKIDAWAASQTAAYIESKLMAGSMVALDLSKVNALEASAAAVIGKSFESLSRSNAQVTLTGSRALQRVLANATPSMDASVPKDVWEMRLELLRLLGKHEDYENVALEYTMTYEVSPTAWHPVNCRVVQSEAELSLVPTEDAAPSGFTNGTASVQGDSRRLNPEPAALEGEVVDGTVVVSAAMKAAAKSSPVMVSCARLKRIDFSSAGDLLNWVLELEAEGKAVILTDSHRLVAAFFNVIGIGGHARVSLRKD